MRISDWSSDVCSSDLVDLPDTQARLNEELDDVRRNAANALGNGQLERAQEGYRLLADAGQQADADAGLQRVAAAWAHRAETLAADFRFAAADAALDHEHGRASGRGRVCQDG